MRRCHFVPFFFEPSLISLCVLLLDHQLIYLERSREDPGNAVMETEFNSISSHDGQSLLLRHAARMGDYKYLLSSYKHRALLCPKPVNCLLIERDFINDLFLL